MEMRSKDRRDAWADTMIIVLFFHTQFHGLVTFKRMKRFGDSETGTVS